MAKGWQDGVRNRPLYWPRDYLMNGDPKARNVLALLTALFLALAVGFALVPAQPGAPVRVPIVPRSALAIAPMTVRISAAQLLHGSGDASGLDCYACHHRDHYVWHPEWGAYGLWGYGACWRWDFGTDRWVNICY